MQSLQENLEDNHIYKFLAGLNIEFDEVRGRIICRKPLPSLGEVFSKVRREESRRNVMIEKKSSSGSIDNSALVVSDTSIVSDANASKAIKNQRKTDKRSRGWCDYCDKPNHTRETCWKIHGKPAHLKNNRMGQKSNRTFPSANEAETSPFTKEQMDHLLNLLKSNSFSSIPAGSLAQTGSDSNALTCYLKSLPWIIDSSASDHMTNFSNLFSTYFPCPGNEKIRIADGSFSRIAGKGFVKLSENIGLKSVLHVPKLACNLLSVSKLSKDSNCRSTFFDSHCEFQDRSSGRMIRSNKMIDSLYYFDDNFSSNKIAQASSSISFASAREQITLWHLRLGHPSFPYLRHLFPSLFKGLDCSSFQCESCHLSKSRRSTYLSKPYHASKPFYQIHSDIWGPSKVTTLSGKR